ncbi:MAG: hypothetical protein ACTHQQ_03305, partial [Solirubrobacteraceae bacterium]
SHSPPASLVTPSARGVVETAGQSVPLFLSRGYPDAASQARPAPRFHCARGLLAEIGSALLLAKTAHRCLQLAASVLADPGASDGVQPPPEESAPSTNHQARGGRLPAVIWLLLQPGERPKE